MPEWKFPIELPRFTDDDMKVKKAAYVAKNGYYVSPPRLKDIIHIRFHDEPDDQEWTDFKSRKLKKDNPKRHQEIEDLLQDKRDRYNRIKASPAPSWLTNIGSVMTFFDDINDMLGTAAVVCRIAARFAPKFLSRFFLGPAGWLLLLADLAGFLMSLWRLPLSCIASKRHFETVGDYNPFSKKSKARRAKKLRRVLPGKGEMIELLQTTDQLFGIGLCLGPIVGFAQDIVAGTVRTIRGEKVTWSAPPSKPTSPERNALSCLRFAQVVGLASDEFTEDEHLSVYIALNAATQFIKPYIDAWNPMDEVNGLQNVLFGAPVPDRHTTIEVLKENGHDPNSCVGWPGLNRTHGTADQLWNFYQAPGAKRFYDFCIRNRRNFVGSVGAQNAQEFGMNMSLFASGYDSVDFQFSDGWDGWHDWFSNGCQMADCHSVGIGGCSDSKGHVVFFSDYWWYVGGCSQEKWPRPKKLIDRCINVLCRDCEIIITPDMCPSGYQEWVVAASVYKYKGVRPPPDWP